MSPSPAPRAGRRRLPEAPPSLGGAGHQRRPQGRRAGPDRRRSRLPLPRRGRPAADAPPAGDPGKHLPDPRDLQPDSLRLWVDRDLPLRDPTRLRALLLPGAASDRLARHRAATPRAARHVPLRGRGDGAVRRVPLHPLRGRGEPAGAPLRTHLPSQQRRQRLGHGDRDGDAGLRLHRDQPGGDAAHHASPRDGLATAAGLRLGWRRSARG